MLCTDIIIRMKNVKALGVVIKISKPSRLATDIIIRMKNIKALEVVNFKIYIMWKSPRKEKYIFSRYYYNR